MSFCCDHKALNAPVTALEVASGCVVAGQGPLLRVFPRKKSGDVVVTENLLTGHRIHGICFAPKKSGSERLLVLFGQRAWRVCSLLYADEGTAIHARVQAVTDIYRLADWIWDVQWVAKSPGCPDETNYEWLAIATAHNIVQLWSWRNNECVSHVESEVSCILYSCCLYGHSPKNLVAIGGTVFNQLLVWKPFSGSPCANGRVKPALTLTGHRGVIFSAAVNIDGTSICSASDDRSVRVWDLNLNHLSAGNVCKSRLELYGHAARVWKAVFIGRLIVSVGEDAVCCVWNDNGHLLKTLKGHKGLNIWSVAVNPEEASIVTGGGDGAIRYWSLSDLKLKDPSQTCILLPTNLKVVDCAVTVDELPVKDFPRNVFVTSSESLLIATNGGCLYRYEWAHVAANRWHLLSFDTTFSSYSVYASLLSAQVIAMGNLSGEVRLVCWDQAGVFIQWSAHVGKVFSISWAKAAGADLHLFTVGPEGDLAWWQVLISPSRDQISFYARGRFLLPICKHRWLSAVAMVSSSQSTDATCPTPFIVCGDRKGSLHVFCTSVDEERKESVCTLPGVHGRNGVTDLQLCNGLVHSTGRDGQIRSFHLADNGQLHETRKRKFLQGITWIERLVPLSTGQTLVVGFHSTDLMVWHSDSSEPLVTIPCGGGHRSWDVAVASTSQTELVVAFVQSNTVRLCCAHLPLNDNCLLQPSFHGREVTCMDVVASDRTGAALLATASEDCSLLISSYYQGRLEKTTLTYSHISSIRSLATMPLDCHQWLLVSGGGRAQIICAVVSSVYSNMTPLQTDTDCSQSTYSAACNAEQAEPLLLEQALSRLNICMLAEHPPVLSQKETRERRRNPPSDILESRVMALTAFSVPFTISSCQKMVPANQRSGQTPYIAAGYSDGLLRLFWLDVAKEKLCAAAESDCPQHSVQALAHSIFIEDRVCLLISGSTRGRVTVWDVTELVIKPTSSGTGDSGMIERDWHSHTPQQGVSDRSKTEEAGTVQADNAHTINLCSSTRDSCCTSSKNIDGGKEMATLQAVFAWTAHSASVTSLTVTRVEERGILVATGGDDGALSCSRLDVAITDQGQQCVNHTWVVASELAHGSSVTGAAFLLPGYIATSSCDQQLKIWRLRMLFRGSEATGGQRDAPVLEEVEKILSSVCDCHALVSWNCSENQALVAVAGAGLQIIEGHVVQT